MLRCQMQELYQENCKEGTGKGKGKVEKHSVPSSPGDHPELYTSEFLDNDRHLYFHMLVGMLNWIVGIGRFDISPCYLTTSALHLLPKERSPRMCLEGVWLLE